MKDRFRAFFSGRHGMDELSKALFWSGLLAMILGVVCAGLLNGIPAVILRYLGLIALIFSFVRAFSRKLDTREAENRAYLSQLDKKKRQWAAHKDRRRQSGDYRFFKCPGCGIWLRVPRNQGKIHIKCKCGYTLYRKT